MNRGLGVLAALLCVVSGVTAGIAPAAATPHAGAASERPHLAGPAAPVQRGTATTLRGTAGRHTRVTLQRRASGTWVRVAARRSGAAGRFAFRVVVRRSAAYRATSRGHHSRVVRVRVLPPAPPGARRTAGISAPAATWPHTRLPVTAVLTPAHPWGAVVLQAEVGGAWQRVAAGVEDASGRVRFTVAPEATTRYRVTAADGARSAATRIAVRPARTGPWVTGYYAGWFWDQGYAPDQVDMSDLTHVIFGRVAPGGGSLGGRPGQVVPGAGSAHDPDASPYPGTTVEDRLVDDAHAAGVQALLMLGGDGFDGRGFVASTADGVRSRFVRHLVDRLVAHDYDGVDIDWENCLGGQAWECGVDISTAEAVRRLEALVLDVRAEMATRPRYATDPGLVTFPGYPVSINALQDGRVARWQAELPGLVDQYNLMSYGIGTTWNGAGWDSWFSGALAGAGPTTPVSIDDSIDAYVRSGAPREKIGLGIGFYGIYYGPTITGPRQPTEGNDVYETDDVALSYARLAELGYLGHGTLHWDEQASSTYRTYGPGGYVPPAEPGLPPRSPAGLLSYEDEQSIAAKADYVAAGGAGGAMLWTLNYGALPDGTNPLLDAVGRSFLGR